MGISESALIDKLLILGSGPLKYKEEDFFQFELVLNVKWAAATN